jgi:hypothetical protein
MTRNVLRLGGGPSGVEAISLLASSPGPRLSRSRGRGLPSKAPPTGPDLRASDQACGPAGLKGVEPAVDGIGVAGLVRALAGYPVGGFAVGDHEQGRGAFAGVGAGVVFAELVGSLALMLSDSQGAAVGHRGVLQQAVQDGPLVTGLPILDVKTQQASSRRVE